ncbi:Voltage-dependent anion-selective channel protein 1 [Cricetulus griseus]|uniref:Non-selective voltage-gated ion channel VDAC1 n=1 Tax=Cricetulus griseus TaxID=10029 RepID=G3HPM9_CRIGR|nr:Voltage-dependent anion-selective channel protein 1 [Cricetulus griseus]
MSRKSGLEIWLTGKSECFFPPKSTCLTLIAICACLAERQIVTAEGTAENSDTRFGIATKYQVDPDACFSAKMNNSTLIHVGYTQNLKPRIKLTLSALLDSKNVNVGGHKLGLGLEFQA